MNDWIPLDKGFSYDDIARRQPNWEHWRNLQAERGVLPTDLVQPQQGIQPMVDGKTRFVSTIAIGLPALVVVVSLALMYLARR